MKEFLSKNNIDYTYLDISDSLINLKAFLKLRDFRPEFNGIKEKNRIGIPLIVVNNGEKLYFDKPDDISELK